MKNKILVTISFLFLLFLTPSVFGQIIHYPRTGTGGSTTAAKVDSVFWFATCVNNVMSTNNASNLRNRFVKNCAGDSTYFVDFKGTAKGWKNGVENKDIITVKGLRLHDTVLCGSLGCDTFRLLTYDYGVGSIGLSEPIDTTNDLILIFNKSVYDANGGNASTAHQTVTVRQLAQAVGTSANVPEITSITSLPTTNATKAGDRRVISVDTTEGYFLTPTYFIRTTIKSSTEPPRTQISGNITIDNTKATWKRIGLSTNPNQSINFVYDGQSWKPHGELKESDFGAIEDTDSYLSIKKFIDFSKSINRSVQFSANKVYKISQELDISNVNIDFNNCTLKSIHTNMNSITHPNNAILFAKNGKDTLIGIQAANTAIEGNSFLKTTYANQFQTNDLIMFEDTTNFSFGVSSIYDRNGQYLEVQSVRNDTIFFKTLILKTFVNQFKLYKSFYTSATYKNVTIFGTNNDALKASEIVMKIGFSRGINIDNVKIYDASYTGLELRNSLNGIINNCIINKTSPDNDAGLSYGLGIASCSNIVVQGGSFYGDRHGITMGAYNVPCLNVSVYSANIASKINHAADFHMPVRNSSYINCYVTNGINLSGEDNSVLGCSLFSNTQSCITLSGKNAKIQNCNFNSFKNVLGTFIIMLNCQYLLSDSSKAVIDNNTFNYNNSVGNNSFIYLECKRQNYEIQMTNNKLYSSVQASINITGQPATPFKKVIINGNFFYKTRFYSRNILNKTIRQNIFEQNSGYAIESENYTNLNTETYLINNQYIDNSISLAFWAIGTGMDKVYQFSDFYKNTGTNNAFNNKARFFNIDSCFVIANSDFSDNTVDYLIDNSNLISSANFKLRSRIFNVISQNGATYENFESAIKIKNRLLTIPTIAPNSQQTVIVNVTGAEVGNLVAIGDRNLNTGDGITYRATVTAANTVTITFANTNNATTTGGFARNFDITIFKD